MCIFNIILNKFPPFYNFWQLFYCSYFEFFQFSRQRLKPFSICKSLFNATRINSDLHSCFFIHHCTILVKKSCFFKMIYNCFLDRNIIIEFIFNIIFFYLLIQIDIDRKLHIIFCLCIIAKIFLCLTPYSQYHITDFLRFFCIRFQSFFRCLR